MNIRNMTLRDTKRLVVGAALVCGAILLPGAALATAPVSLTRATLPSCQPASTAVWAAVEGYGTAGTIYYELEFSNIGTRPCTLRGFPDVWAISLRRAEIGRPASHQNIVPRTVTLQPGATAHAVLGVVDTGALCGRRGVAAAGLSVVPPGQPMAAGESDEVQSFPLEVCPNVSSMSVRPVHSGTGIPGYTFS